MRKEYKAYGWWKVTTEGDCEGRTIIDLGIHHGYLDKIAFALGGKAYYSLKFQSIDKPEVTSHPSPVKSVNIQLDVDSGTWDLRRGDRAEAIRKILKGRRVTVEECNFYATVTLKKK
jgi:hypothetical protein